MQPQGSIFHFGFLGEVQFKLVLEKWTFEKKVRLYSRKPKKVDFTNYMGLSSRVKLQSSGHLSDKSWTMGFLNRIQLLSIIHPAIMEKKQKICPKMLVELWISYKVNEFAYITNQQQQHHHFFPLFPPKIKKEQRKLVCCLLIQFWGCSSHLGAESNQSRAMATHDWRPNPHTHTARKQANRGRSWLGRNLEGCFLRKDAHSHRGFKSYKKVPFCWEALSSQFHIGTQNPVKKWMHNVPNHV